MTDIANTQARYPAPDLANLPDDIRAKILEVQEKAGFIPNVFLGFARRPSEWRAFFAYHDALMLPGSAGRTSNLTKGDREMIVTTTSAANNCLRLKFGVRSFIIRLLAKTGVRYPPAKQQHFDRDSATSQGPQMLPNSLSIK